MEVKEKLNQTPDISKDETQEENSKSVEETESISDRQVDDDKNLNKLAESNQKKEKPSLKKDGKSVKKKKVPAVKNIKKSKEKISENKDDTKNADINKDDKKTEYNADNINKDSTSKSDLKQESNVEVLDKTDDVSDKGKSIITEGEKSIIQDIDETKAPLKRNDKKGKNNALTAVEEIKEKIIESPKPGSKEEKDVEVLEEVKKEDSNENAGIITEKKGVTSVDINNKETTLIKDNKVVKKSVISVEESKEEAGAVIEKQTTVDIEKSYDTYSKEQLVEELEKVVKETNINFIKTKVALIKVAFLKINKEDKKRRFDKFIAEGGKKEDYEVVEDPIELRYKNAFDIYKKNKARYNEEQERIKKKNLEIKKNILEELKVLINSEETLKKTYDEFKELQKKWKEIGMVPKAEVNNLWQNYHFLVEKFFDKVKINKELRDLDLKKNLESKIELCEKAEELLLENSITRSFKQLQKYHEQWKEIGPVARDKKDEIWERFKSATDKINERRREYYSKLQQEQQNNYAAKLALCDKAEKIVSEEINTTRRWQKSTDQINELLNIWKSVGRAPKKLNDEIWNRFKTYLDTFFSNKKNFFAKLKEQQINNYNLKIDLCIQAEALKSNTDWRETKHEIINLQKEWRNIGPVPKKYSNKIWKRFRSACDEFFNNMDEYYKNVQSREDENLKMKTDLIKEIKDYKFSDDKNENLNVLKDFQRQWMDIGYVPIKEKNKLQYNFREVINSKLDELKINPIEIKTMNYKTRFESIKDSPDAYKIINKEKNYIINKINKLKDNINLWENNIGFLAESKKADLLKEEFKNKINRAKQDIAVFKAKLKYLNH